MGQGLLVAEACEPDRHRIGQIINVEMPWSRHLQGLTLAVQRNIKEDAIDNPKHG